MNTLHLNTQLSTTTDIHIGTQLAENLQAYISELHPSQVVWVTDSVMAEQTHKLFSINHNSILITQPGEHEKNLENLTTTLQFFHEKNLDKKSLVIAIGGGVISDMVGFAASIFRRGVPLILVPTTLLAAVDAAVGGKNTINFMHTKNVLGTVYQPKAVFIDTQYLQTLPERQFNSGMAEIIKYGTGFDAELFSIISDKNNLKNNLEDVIMRSVKIKVEVVQEDPTESQGKRKLLNLGHTLGHALEAQEDLQLTHGEAVAIGLHFSAFISAKMGNISAKDVNEIINLLQKYSLPIRINFDLKKTLEKMKHDKKKAADSIDFVLIKKMGECYTHSLSLDQITNYLDQFKNL